jgi:hypothetical protein
MDDEVETGPVPNGDEGWGRVDLTNLIGSPRTYLFLDQTQLLQTGQTYEQRIAVASSDEPLKITLAYTDVPGFPGVIPALVNDLDLEVEGPGGEVYLGNQFDEGESVAGSSAPDRFNNVEAVHLSEPDPGEYIVRVRARNVVRDARRDTPAVVDQDFALVISADITPAGTPIVFLDRPAYTAPSEIRIKLVDSALGPTNVLVTVQSTTESAVESVLLRATTFGSFTGRIVTAMGPATLDGRLQIAHGNLIQVSFTDSASGHSATATAVADFIPPVISNVTVTNRFGRTLISWDTDEPATSIVRFGTNSSLGLAETNLARVQSHEVSLSDLRAGTVYYFLVASADAARNAATNSGGVLSFTAVGAPTLLLVDNYIDDGVWTFVPLSVYTDTLNAIGTSYDVWDAQLIGHTPSFEEMRPFRLVVWRLSDSIFGQAIDATDQGAIRQYLAGGGAFFLSSMEQLSRITSSFKQDVLHVQNFNTDAGVPEILGPTGNPLTAGIDMQLDYSLYDDDLHEGFDIPLDISDTFTPTSDAAPLLLNAQTREVAGMMYPRIGQNSTGRVAFLSFPLDAVPTNGTAPNSRIALMRNIINFLAPGQSGSQINFDSSEYTLPSLVTVELADAGLAGVGHASVNIYSDTVTNRIVLSLAETIPPGLFRGSITLTNAGVSAPNHLQARNGDRLRAEYFDQSANISITATALVDTVYPIISGIVSNADFVQATISWDTSKDADGLVQFGESKFLGRTGYDPDFNTFHEVVLTGLLPDHDYYYKVVSRDLAGNTATADDAGEPFLLHTLHPIRPPYSDGFDQGAPNWDVFSDGSSTEWTLGVPHNGRDAYSPPNAWCSSINGADSDGIDTFLLSPAIDLTAAATAKLKFQTSYDFSDPTGDDIYQEGLVLIFTNQVSDPAIIGEYVDDSGGWYQEELDLTPYVGNVVNLVWYHTLLTFESAPRVGWMIDDVELTSTPLLPGLRIDRLGTNVVVSWPADDPSWFLVSKRSLATNALWSPVAEGSLVNGRYYVTNAASGPACFYALSKTSGAPALAIGASGPDVTLSWPTNSLNYVLQTSDSIPPARWDTVTNRTYLNGRQQSVTLPRSGQARFFRLVPP